MSALVFESILLIVQIGLFVWAFLFAMRLLIWVFSGAMDAPFVPTPRRYAIEISRALSYQPGDVVYELGSGDGRLLLVLALFEPRARFVGIERNLLLYIWASARKRFSGNPSNVEFRWQNFFETDLRDATKLYTYLLHRTMQKLAPKFDQELKHARLASRAFPIASKELTDVVELSKTIGAHGQHLLFIYDY